MLAIYSFCKVHVRWKWPVVKDKHIRMKPKIYVHVLFVFDLDGECEFIKNKTSIHNFTELIRWTQAELE